MRISDGSSDVCSSDLEENAAAALVKFAEMDGRDRLLGRGFTRFDLRDPTKLVARKGETIVNHDVSEDSHGKPAVYDGVTTGHGAAAGDVEQGSIGRESVGVRVGPSV